jgi:hypothetical protein
MDSQDLQLASKDHKIMLEAREAALKSARKHRKPKQETHCLQCGSEVGCIIEGRQVKRPTSNLSLVPAKVEGNLVEEGDSP